MCEWLSSMIERTNGWDWGDVPTWAASFAGLAALVVASYAAAKTRAMLKIESDRDKEAREREERAQADLVAAWLVKDAKRGDSIFPWYIVITNASTVPVYAFRFVVIVAGPASADDNNTIERSFSVVPPGEQHIDLMSLNTLMTSVLTGDEAKAEMRRLNKDKDSVISACSVWIAFRDASGQHWMRASDGILDRGLEGPFSPDAQTSTET